MHAMPCHENRSRCPGVTQGDASFDASNSREALVNLWMVSSKVFQTLQCVRNIYVRKSLHASAAPLLRPVGQAIVSGCV